MDTNKDGILNRNELKNLLLFSGEEVTREIVEIIFSIIDIDNSGTISFDEFVN